MSVTSCQEVEMSDTSATVVVEMSPNNDSCPGKLSVAFFKFGATSVGVYLAVARFAAADFLFTE